MNRGDALQWGIQIDTDGKVINVTISGGHKPDLTFDTPEAFTEWFDEEWQGLQIGRMGRGAIETAIRMADAELAAEIAKTLEDGNG